MNPQRSHQPKILDLTGHHQLQLHQRWGNQLPLYAAMRSHEEVVGQPWKFMENIAWLEVHHFFNTESTSSFIHLSSQDVTFTRPTLWKTNMEPANGPLEEEICFRGVYYATLFFHQEPNFLKNHPALSLTNCRVPPTASGECHGWLLPSIIGRWLEQSGPWADPYKLSSGVPINGLVNA